MRGGAVREPPGTVIGCCFHLVATFFSMIFMTLFFSHNNAKSAKKVPKILPKSARNLTLAQFSLIFCTPCFWTTLHCFCYISLVWAAPNSKKNILLGTFLDAFWEPYFGMASGWHFHVFCFFLGLCWLRFLLLFGHRFGIDFQRVSGTLPKSKPAGRWWRLGGIWGPKNKSTEAKQLTRSANEQKNWFVDKKQSNSRLQTCDRR